MTTPQHPQQRPDEAGFMLPLVLIIVAIGAMVVIGLLGYASGLLRVGGEDADALKELYAADAGITHVKKLLEQGPLPNEIPSIEVNDLEVTMGVTPVATPGAAVPTPWPRPLNPELKEGHLGSHLVTLYSVPEGTEADISWAITRLTPTPTPTPTSIQIVPNPTATPTPTPTPTPIYPSLAIYAGLGGGTPIATAEPFDESPRREFRPGDTRWLDVKDVELLDAETFVVDFDHGTLTDLASDPFAQDSEKCDSPTEPFFCLTTPAMDYIVVSRAGDTTVTAYVRQMPFWELDLRGGINYTFSGAEVVTLSWKPYPPDE
ncbi:MAG: hypothetical protein F4X72_08070 [Dehalococcoidia bacterium]|nr:hypothetical protein [Dehalococcoidia bacterium]